MPLSTSVKTLPQHVTLNSQAMENIKWWLTFLPLWNGKQKILDVNVTRSLDLNLFTDASGVSCFGIYFNGRWVAQPWPPYPSTHIIPWKELCPIYLACVLWAKEFQQKRLLFHCDGLAITTIWSTGTSKCPKIISLTRK